jgi:hypothetical protein
VSERRARHSHRAEMRTTQAHTRRRSVSHEGGLMRMQQQSASGQSVANITQCKDDSVSHQGFSEIPTLCSAPPRDREACRPLRVQAQGARAHQ